MCSRSTMSVAVLRMQVASRVENLYFTYLFTLRAVQKAAPLLQALQYSSGYIAEDSETAQLVSKLVRYHIVRSVSYTAAWTLHALQIASATRRTTLVLYMHIGIGGSYGKLLACSNGCQLGVIRPHAWFDSAGEQ